MTLEEIFQAARQKRRNTTLPEVIRMVNECMRNDKFMTTFAEQETVYSAGSASMDIDEIYAQDVDVIEAILMKRNGRKYRIPSQAHVGNSQFYYELKDRNLYIRERQHSEAWDTPSEDLDLIIKAEVLPPEVNLEDAEQNNELPVDNRLHAAIREYVLSKVFFEKAGEVQSAEISKQMAYLSQAHEKKYWQKLERARHGNIEKSMYKVKPDPTTSVV